MLDTRLTEAEGDQLNAFLFSDEGPSATTDSSVLDGYVFLMKVSTSAEG